MIILFLYSVVSLVANYEYSITDNKAVVNLDWSDLTGSFTHFRVMRYKDGSSEAQMISTMNFIEGNTIKVLNLYPVNDNHNPIPDVEFTYRNGTTATLPKSTSLKVWMEGGDVNENGVITHFEPAGAISTTDSNGITATKQLIEVD